MSVARLALVACVSAAVVSFAQQPPIPTGTGVVSGRVVDGVTGRPLRGMQVTIAQVGDASINRPMVNSPGVAPAPRSSGPYPGQTTTTNDQGQFTFSKVPAGSFEITPSRDGVRPPDFLAPAAGPLRWIEVAEGQRLTGLELKYFQPSRVGGRVIDKDGTPIAGIEIQATVPGVAPRTRGLLNEVVTDDRGRYAFSVQPGEYFISALQFPAIPERPTPGPSSAFATTYYPQAASSRDASLIAIKPGEDRAGIDFMLQTQRVFQITGGVTGEYPGQRIGIELIPAEPGVAPEPIVSIGIVGRVPFGFATVPPGRYTIRALSPPNMLIGSHGNPPLETLPAEPTLWAESTVTIVNRDVQVALDLRPGARVHGRIEFEGQTPKPSLEGPLPFGIIAERADGRSSDFRGAYTPDGRFSTIQIEPGQYLLSAWPPKGWRLKSVMHDGHDLRDYPFEVGAEDIRDVVITFTDQRSAVAGRVSRQPPYDTTRGWVTVFPSDRALWSNYGTAPRRIAFVELGRAGAFEAEVPPGSYFVAATDRSTRGRITADTLARLAAIASPIVVGENQTARVELQMRSIQR